MKIKKIKIKNYRILRNFSVDIEDDLSLIVGKNNSGKTSVLYILDKFITQSKVNSKVNFSWDDFSIRFREDLEKSLTKEEYPYNDSFPGICMRLFIKYDPSDDLSNISEYMLDLDEKNNMIILEFSYTISNEKFSDLKNDYQKTEDVNVFLEKNFKKYFNLNWESIFYDLDNDKEGDSRKKIKFHDNLISFKYLSAKRDISNEEKDKLGYLASKYYKTMDENIDKEIIDEFNNTINNTDKKINKTYGKIFKDVTDKIKKFGGVKQGESSINIVSSINKKKLLEGNSKVIYTENDHNLPENYNGLGYLNLFHMIFNIELILMSFRKDDEENISPADINLLFIEEPEVHTHPQMQYIFIENIKTLLKKGCSYEKRQLNLQTIITTHSSHIVSKSDFNDIKYFYKSSENDDIIAKNLTDLEKEYSDVENNFKFLKQYLTLNSSELFFAEKAIFIEGDTERILLPKMMEMIDTSESNDESLPLLSQKISIIEVGNYSHIFEKFIDFIGIKSLVITDIDSGKDKGEKCSVNDRIITTSPSLKFFFQKSNSGNEMDLDELKNLKFEDKVFKKFDGKWIKDENGILRISYQTLQEKVDYYPRTFEDAFISLNKCFIKENKDIFMSLKNFNEFESNGDYYELAEKTIGKKSGFAIEILISSSNSENCSFEIPNYIKEGLSWLKKV